MRIGTGSNAQVQIYVDKWSTAAERELLVTTMVEKGPQDLLKTLQKPIGQGAVPKSRPCRAVRSSQPVGWGLVSSATRGRHPCPRAGWPHRAGRLTATSGWLEAQQATPINRLSLHAVRDPGEQGRRGRGELTVNATNKIRFDKDKKVLELENYSSEPVRLNNLKVKVRD